MFWGIKSKTIQERLLCEDLDFTQASDIAIAQEMATHDTRELHRKKVHKIDRSDESGEDSESELEVYAICMQCPPRGISLQLGDEEYKMELDTSSAVSVMSYEQCRELRKEK